MKKNQILDHAAVMQKIRRIAYQVVENNFDEKELVMIGIEPTGFAFAEVLKKEISAISKMSVSLYPMTLDKINPLESDIEISLNGLSLNGKNLLFVDDVANTGKTMFYAIKPVLEFSPKKVQLAVLIDRLHKRYPIAADFVGLSLSTTLQEQILVKCDKGKFSAFLT